ncbi:MAG: hypothetical protein ACI8UG_002733, partial [Gammaproteobacteria bacterium]
TALLGGFLVLRTDNGEPLISNLFSLANHNT